MSLIRIQKLTFAYEGSYDNIFEDVNFYFETEWKLGFTGRNGRGKTTFLRLLMGELSYSGTISAEVDFAYFPYEVSAPERAVGAVLHTLCPQAETWELERELSLLGMPENVRERPFCTLSSGEQTKVLLAALFLGESRFLLIDEPTNHLDAEGRQVVGAYLSRKQGFLLVSHDRALLDACTDHTLAINRANIEVQRGSFSTWWRSKQLQDAREVAENERLQKDIVRLSDAAKRTSGWSEQVEQTKFGTKNSGLRPDRGYIGHKAAKMMQRSKSIEKRQQAALKEKSALLHNIEHSAELKITPLRFHTAQLVELQEVSIFYGDHAACAGVSFAIKQGDRAVLQGRNGSGKSSVLRLICGEMLQYSGTQYKNGQLRISYVPQTKEGLCGSLSDYARQHGIDESLFKAILRKLDFSRVQFEKNMQEFSAGQQKKVLIARSLCERAHLYVWDEPLNFIDVISRMQIEALLLEYQPTLLFVEHDRAFCDRVATRYITLR